MLRSFVVSIFLASALSAQEPEAPTIQANTSLVLAPVTVTDQHGKLIDGLTVDDFRLTDEGVAQKLRLDTSDTVLAPVSMVVLVQSSGISEPALARIRRVGSMIKPIVLGERGQAAVLAFDDDVRVLQDFTPDADEITAAIERISGRTVKTGRMIDAVIEGVQMLAKQPQNNRKILLMLSESRDRGSKAKLQAAMEEAQRSGAVIYTGTYSPEATALTSKPEDNPPMPAPAGANVDFAAAIGEFLRLGKTNAAEALARATGGRHLSFNSFDSLQRDLTRTGEEIHSQYLLSFVPAETGKKGFHPIQVAIPSHPEAIIRVRPGYWTEK